MYETIHREYRIELCRCVRVQHQRQSQAEASIIKLLVPLLMYPIQENYTVCQAQMYENRMDVIDEMGWRSARDRDVHPL